MKKVVFLSETMPLGGASTFVLNICRGLSESTSWQGITGALRNLGDVGSQIRGLGLPVVGPRPSSLLHEERIEDLYQACSRHSPHAVVAALSSGSFDFLRFVPEGCLRIGMIQSDEEGFYDLVVRYLPWLDAVAGVSLEICRKMESRLGDYQIPVIHQPYGVPMPEGEPVRQPAGPLRVLYLGRVIEEQKRVNLMARVMKSTLQVTPDIEWTIAGDGPDLDFLKSEFASHRQVRFLGSVPYDRVPSLLTGHDVYFLCSNYEGLPLSLLEAMGAGLVPVVSDLPSGISEVVNEQNGIRIAVDDEAGYASALTQLAKDPARLTALSTRAGCQVRNSHSVQAMSRRWETMLDERISGPMPVWKSSCRGTAPLGLHGQWRFHPAFRPLRVFVKRFKRWKLSQSAS